MFDVLDFRKAVFSLVMIIRSVKKTDLQGCGYLLKLFRARHRTQCAKSVAKFVGHDEHV